MNSTIDNWTNWFLEQKALVIFLICAFIGLPLYLWMFSIIYQLDKRRNFKRTKAGLGFLYFVAFYPIIYAIIFILFMVILLFSNNVDVFYIIIPFHILAMICSLIIMIICSTSLTRFQKFKQIKRESGFVNFILLAYFIVGVWIIQPNLNKYIEE